MKQLVALLAICGFLVGSAGPVAHAASPLVGKWVEADEHLEVFEFGPDGFVQMSNAKVGIKHMRARFELLTGNQLKIHFENYPLTFTYAVSGSKLTLTAFDGSRTIYHRG